MRRSFSSISVSLSFLSISKMLVGANLVAGGYVSCRAGWIFVQVAAGFCELVAA